jgi:HK97 family phage major capsid protein
MANINQIVADISNDIRKDRDALENIVAIAEARGSKSLTAAEDRKADALYARIRDNQAKLERAKKVQAEEDALEERLSEVRPTNAYAGRSDRTQTVSVTSEPRTYNRGSDPNGISFLRDVGRAMVLNDPEAQSRLSRHMQEERIDRPEYAERAAGDLTSGAIGGVSVPQYLVDLTALAAAARRPFADSCTKHVLPPDGLTFVVPTFTAGTSVANQATQLTAVSAQSMTEADLTLNVYTAAGSQNVSRQAIDRSRIDEFVLSDLMTRYATNLDSNLLNMATVGLAAKAASTLGAYADTSPTGAKLYPKILAAASGVETVVQGTNANLAVMHSRRWNWLSKEMTSSWPLINSQGLPTQAGGVSGPGRDYGSGIRGVLPNGIAVVVDNNVTTTASSNQDEIYVVPSAECHLWEAAGSPAYIRAEQPNAANLGVLFVVYGYYGFTYDRYGAGSMQKVSGTGLTTPAF